MTIAEDSNGYSDVFIGCHSVVVGDGGYWWQGAHIDAERAGFSCLLWRQPTSGSNADKGDAAVSVGTIALDGKGAVTCYGHRGASRIRQAAVFLKLATVSGPSASNRW